MANDTVKKMLTEAMKKGAELTAENKKLKKENERLQSIIICLAERYAKATPSNLVLNWLAPDMPNKICDELQKCDEIILKFED